ncbi:MAG: MBL fold metallo-hydrolase [Lachnospiraceae bacterium]|nr:MBL fold metallo-hydrolase [Lachnospiraceae bacterium]
MLKVTFVHHSCFVVELDHTVLVFDYFPGEAVEEYHFTGVMPPFPEGKKVYVFASHKHRDHFSLEVLRWVKDNPNISYIFSKDIRLGRNYLLKNGFDLDIKKKIKFVSAINEYEIDDIKVETLKSTDEGVAFVVDVEGICVYHAGDLHWWNWGQKDELYAEAYGTAYKRELRRIGEKHIDIAFVVLDPRMGEEGYALGMEHFIKNISCDLVFPMHLWQDFDLIQKFKSRPQIAHFKDKIIDIDRENLIFEIEE